MIGKHEIRHQDEIKVLLDDTHRMLKNSHLSPEMISRMKSVDSCERWIYKFMRKEIKDPSINRVNNLRNALIEIAA